MSDIYSIMLVDDDQQFADSIITALCATSAVEYQLIYVEDKEDLDLAVKTNSFESIIFNQSVDFDYLFLLSYLQQQNLKIPVVLMLHNEAEFASSSPNSVLNQSLKFGVQQAVYYKNYYHLASVIKHIHTTNTLKSELLTLQQSASEAAMREEDLLGKATAAVCFIQDGVVIFANQPLVKLFYYPTTDDVIGLPFIDLIEPKDSIMLKHLLKAFSKDDYKQNSVDCVSVKANGERFECHMRFNPAHYENERCTQVIFIAEQEVSSSQHRSGSYEVVGDLPEQVAGSKVLKEHLNILFTSKANTYGLMVVSVDNLKQYSHVKLSGRTDLVNEYAHFLTEYFLNDSIYRLGDTIFAVLTKHYNQAAFFQQAITFKDLVAQHEFWAQGMPIHLTLSIGICKSYPTMDSGEDLLENAFDCAQKVRHNGGNNVALFEPIETQSIENKTADAILEAIQNNQFVLKFQHILSTIDEDSQFFEVFLRLQLTDGTLVKPDNFLARAKEIGLNGSLDKWVMMNACKQLKTYQNTYPNTKILINLSEFVLQDPEHIQLIHKLLSALGPTFAKSIIFQFTEQNIMLYLKTAIQTLATIKALGGQVSINCFGTSMSSFSIFEHVNCDMVKLDRSLVQDWDNSEAIEKLKQLVSEVSALNKLTIIPFIDNPSSMSAAWKLGARYLQGYFLNSPIDEMQPNSTF